jgi:NSS family neurotransmitter:Na+ symporter
MLIAGFIIYKGVSSGIEKSCKIMIPTLFVLLIIALVRSLTLPGALKGLEYLFSPKLYMLSNPKIWLEAFTQVAWSTGAGWGFIITYSVYTKKKSDIPGNCTITSFGDNIGALIAGMTVLPAIYALSPTQELATQALSSGNTGLTFIYLAQLFTRLPAGQILASIFFLAMAIAALSSLLPMIEVGVRNLMDMGFTRKKATAVIAIVGFILGIPSAYSLKFLDNQDWVWGIGLLVSGVFVAFALMKYGLEKIRNTYINTKWADYHVGKWWNVLIMLFPIFFLAIVLFWFWQATTWYPDSWWKPFEVFSVGTIILQWVLLLILTIVTNNWLARKIGKGRDITALDSEEE